MEQVYIYSGIFKGHFLRFYSELEKKKKEQVNKMRARKKIQEKTNSSSSKKCPINTMSKPTSQYPQKYSRMRENQEEMKILQGGQCLKLIHTNN